MFYSVVNIVPEYLLFEIFNYYWCGAWQLSCFSTEINSENYLLVTFRL